MRCVDSVGSTMAVSLRKDCVPPATGIPFPIQAVAVCARTEVSIGQSRGEIDACVRS